MILRSNDKPVLRRQLLPALKHNSPVKLIEYLPLNNYEICISEDMLTTIYYITKKKDSVLNFF